MKTRLVILLLLSASVFASARLRASPSPPNGVEIQTWHQDTATNSLTIRFLNNSNKDVTDYEVSISVTHPKAGAGQFTVGWEHIGPMVRDEPNAIFHSGAYEDRTVGVGSDGATVTAVRVVLVVYADETVETEDDQLAARLFATRQETVAAMRQLAAAVQKILNNPDDPSPATTALKQVTALYDATIADHKVGGTGAATVYKGAVQNLKQAKQFEASSNLSERDWLQTVFVKPNLDQAATLALHVARRQP